MNTIAVKVIAKVQQAEDIFSYELASQDGRPLPAFSAGAHIDVVVRQGLVRQYSLCNDPSESHRYVIGVLRDPNSRGGSAAMHGAVQQGDVLQISAPRNHFPLVPAQRTLLLAGGIGVTPILCMAERLAQIGADFEMHYCARAPERTAFMQRIADSAFAGHVHFHFDSAGEEQRLQLPALLAQPGSATHLYVCGPGGFIDYVINTAQQQGWRKDQVHFEYFGAAAVDASTDTAFEVKLASSGKCYLIPAGSTVTQVLERHGVDIAVSCEQGVCGTCITRVLEGVPDHRDVYFTEQEHAQNDQFTPCCSRARTATLVLDL